MPRTVSPGLRWKKPSLQDVARSGNLPSESEQFLSHQGTSGMDQTDPEAETTVPSEEGCRTSHSLSLPADNGTTHPTRPDSPE
jgi:hypothetical protein